MSNSDAELISTKEAAALLGEGIRQTIRRVESGTLTPATKLPGVRGAYVFNRSDIIALAASIAEAAPGDAA